MVLGKRQRRFLKTESDHNMQESITTRTTSDLVKAAVSGWLGTALEFMDFQLYSLAAALVFKDIFFPSGHPTIAVLGAMAIYGVGYVARPLGAWYFGRLGDRVGRTKILMITIALMGVATTLIGVLPTYQQIGIFAPALLVVLRLVQGFGAGAEIAGASVMLAEYAPTKRRGIISSLVALGTNSGTLGAGLIWAILLGTIGSDAVVAWGWRIPFLGSLILLGLAVYIRIHLKETPVFEAAQTGEILSDEQLVEVYDKPLQPEDNKVEETRNTALHGLEVTAEREEILKTPKSWKAFLAACMLRFGQSGNSGMVQTYLITFLTANWLVAKDVASSIVVYSSLVGFITVPIIGHRGSLTRTGTRDNRDGPGLAFDYLSLLGGWGKCQARGELFVGHRPAASRGLRIMQVRHEKILPLSSAGHTAAYSQNRH